MKRREFVLASSVGVAGGILLPLHLLRAGACPPPSFSVGGGTATSATCGNGTGSVTDRLISRSALVSATSGNAAMISDADYNSEFRSSGTPVTITYDLSAIPAEARQKLLWQWRCNNTYSVDHALINQAGYNNLGAYTIRGNTAAGGGAAPTTGWTTLVTVNGNTRSSHQHVINNADSYNWLCKVCTASDGSSGNSDIGISVNIHDISGQTVVDGWLIVGDSITANSMEWKNNGSVASKSFGDRVGAVRGVIPPMDHAGWPGISASGLAGANLSVYQAWLADFPGKYVGIILGSNPDSDAATYKSALLTLISTAQNAGKVVVLGKPPYSTDGGHTHIAAYCAQVDAIWAAQPSVKHGPDMQAYFLANTSQLSGDGLHPNDTGNMNFRRLWAEIAIAIYQAGG